MTDSESRRFLSGLGVTLAGSHTEAGGTAGEPESLAEQLEKSTNLLVKCTGPGPGIMILKLETSVQKYSKLENFWNPVISKLSYYYDTIIHYYDKCHKGKGVSYSSSHYDNIQVITPCYYHTIMTLLSFPF